MNPPSRDHARLTVSKVDAAAMLDASVDFFEEHVMPEIRVVRRGRKVLVPIKELERWVEESAEKVLG